jgi:hypothetical protein
MKKINEKRNLPETRLEPLLSSLSGGGPSSLFWSWWTRRDGSEPGTSRRGLETRPQTRLEPLYSLLMGPTVVVAVVVDLVVVDMSSCGRTLGTVVVYKHY